MMGPSQITQLSRTIEALENAFHRSPVRIVPGGIGGTTSASRIYGYITKTLFRGDPLAVPPQQAEIQYRVRLLSEGGIAAWQAGKQYLAGTLVTYNGKYYRCLIKHWSSATLTPEAPGYWEESEPGHTAVVLGYQGNLIESAPWLKVGDVVEVVSVPEYDQNGNEIIRAEWKPDTIYAVGDIRKYQTLLYDCILAHTSTNAILPTNTGYWTSTNEPYKIHATVFQVEKATLNLTMNLTTRVYSLMQLIDEKTLQPTRVAAVFG